MFVIQDLVGCTVRLLINVLLDLLELLALMMVYQLEQLVTVSANVVIFGKVLIVKPHLTVMAWE